MPKPTPPILSASSFLTNHSLSTVHPAQPSPEAGECEQHVIPSSKSSPIQFCCCFSHPALPFLVAASVWYPARSQNTRRAKPERQKSISQLSPSRFGRSTAIAVPKVLYRVSLFASGTSSIPRLRLCSVRYTSAFSTCFRSPPCRHSILVGYLVPP